MPFINQDPHGRPDVALVRVGELVCKREIEPRLGGFPLWDRGLGELVEALVVEAGVPSRIPSLVDVARGLGILRRAD